MEGCGGILPNTERLAQFGCETAHEAGVSVMNELFGESYVLEYMFQIEFGDSFSCYRLIAQNEDYSFGTIMVHYSEY